MDGDPFPLWHGRKDLNASSCQNEVGMGSRSQAVTAIYRPFVSPTLSGVWGLYDSEAEAENDAPERRELPVNLRANQHDVKAADLISEDVSSRMIYVRLEKLGPNVSKRPRGTARTCGTFSRVPSICMADNRV